MEFPKAFADFNRLASIARRKSVVSEVQKKVISMLKAKNATGRPTILEDAELKEL